MNRFNKLFSTAVLFAIAVSSTGCASVADGFYRWEYNSQVPASHGTHQLVKEWYGQPYDKADTWEFASRPHYCQYDNGVVMEGGRQLCPYTL